MTKINKRGLNLIKEFEGLNTNAYRDAADVLTIGYGHTKGVKEGDSITEQFAEIMLDKELREYEGYVDQMVNVPLNENQHAALVSFVYNLGPTNFANSTLLKRLNEGKYEDVPAQIKRWNKARVNGELTELEGLTRRRQAEADLFNEEL
ncbi:MAG: lysozyme [Flavobacteriaceae bacterium]